MTPASDIPTWGDLLTRASVWLALLGYLAGPLAALAGRHWAQWQGTARAIYTAGLVCFLVHVAAAFHFFYGWSHETALTETARETFEAVGRRDGSGLYLNYLFTVLWLADVAWWWRAGLDGFRRRTPWICLVLHGFFVFMAFNATVVFEDGAVRIAGALATAALVAAVLAAWRRRAAKDP